MKYLFIIFSVIFSFNSFASQNTVISKQLPMLTNEQFQSFYDKTDNFQNYPNFPLFLVVNDLNLENINNFEAKVEKVVETIEQVKVSNNFNVDNSKLYNQYKVDYPNIGAALGSNATAALFQLRESEDNVKSRNASISSGVIGYITGSIIGDKKYNEVVNLKDKNYIDMPASYIHFKTNNGKYGKFVQLNDNLNKIRSGDVKVGDKVIFTRNQDKTWSYHFE